MLIKKYSCERFAGIKDKNIDLNKGLNVLLGPNEAGKSTIVDGIYSTLFKSVKLDKRKDKEFINRFMPYPSGDSIDGLVEIETEGNQYTIMKEWGAGAKVILKTPQGDLIKKDETVKDCLSSIFNQGEGTYSSIVFAKQRELKEALSNILENEENRSAISTILRKTVMEMDQVPVDKLKVRLDSEIDNLSKRWDCKNKRPEGGRGISNPYKTGVGTVLKAYYEKENLIYNMEKAKEAEAKFQDICNKLKNLITETEKEKAEINELTKPENDILRRAVLDPEIEMRRRELENITEINKNWPVKEYILEENKRKLRELTKKKTDLLAEKDLANKMSEKEVILGKIKKIEELEGKIKGKKKSISGITQVSEDDIKTLDSLYENMLFIEAKMKAGSIIGTVKSLKTLDIFLTKDLEKTVKLENMKEFKASGFFKLQVPEILEMEVKSQDIDFDNLRNQYASYKGDFEELLKKLKVYDKEQAKLNKKEIEKLNNDVKLFQTELNAVLGTESYENLKNKGQELNNLGPGRNLMGIEQDIKDNDEKLMNIKVEITSNEITIKDWTLKYQSKDKVIDKLIDIKADKLIKERELNNLSSLPEKFKTIDEYKKYLTDLRSKNDENKNLYDKLRDDYFNAEKELPDSSYEELRVELKEKEKEYSHLENRLEKLIKIKSVFVKIMEDMDKDSFRPLADSFSKYLSLVTLGNYKIENMDDSFNLELKNKDNNSMPLDLLSSGTYDSAALALRFSLMEYIMGSSGFIVLDDCLVDLDPERKEKAALIIKEFAKENQVIFTTCSPETASLLGGNLIKI